jgi:hypothetical protein
LCRDPTLAEFAVSLLIAYDLTAIHRGDTMPPEYYLGIAVAAILVTLLGMFLQRWLGTRFVVLHKSSGTDQLANQLSRIADSLEKLVVYLGALPPTDKLPVDKPSVPVEAAPQPSEADPQKVDQPVERHVRLSMFGR